MFIKENKRLSNTFFLSLNFSVHVDMLAPSRLGMTDVKPTNSNTKKQESLGD